MSDIYKSLVSGGHLALVETIGDLAIYENVLTKPAFNAVVLSADLSTMVGNEVWTAIGVAIPFTAIDDAIVGTYKLISLGGLTAIPSLLTTPSEPVAVAPIAPIAPVVATPPIEPATPTPLPTTSTQTKAPRRKRRSKAEIEADRLGGATPPIAALVTASQALTKAIDAKAIDSVITDHTRGGTRAIDTTPPIADDYAGSPIAALIGASDSLSKAIASVVSDHMLIINKAIADITIPAIAVPMINPIPDPVFPLVANKPTPTGINWYLVIGDPAKVSAESAQAIAADLGTAAGITLATPAIADTKTFGQIWFLVLPYQDIERIVIACGLVVKNL